MQLFCFEATRSRAPRRAGTTWLILSLAAALCACTSTRPSQPVEGPPRWVTLPSEPDAPPKQGGQEVFTPQQAQLRRAVLTQGDQSLRLIDTGRLEELWEGIAPFLKAANAQEALMSGIAQRREALGPVQGRARAGLHAVQLSILDRASQALPAGQYASLEYTGQSANGATTLERVSFKLESEGWRFTGYTAQLTSEPLQPSAPMNRSR